MYCKIYCYLIHNKDNFFYIYFDIFININSKKNHYLK